MLDSKIAAVMASLDTPLFFKTKNPRLKNKRGFKKRVEDRSRTDDLLNHNQAL